MLRPPAGAAHAATRRTGVGPAPLRSRRVACLSGHPATVGAGPGGGGASPPLRSRGDGVVPLPGVPYGDVVPTPSPAAPPPAPAAGAPPADVGPGGQRRGA